MQNKFKRVCLLLMSFFFSFFAGKISGEKIDKSADFNLQGVIENNLQSIHNCGNEEDSVQTKFLGTTLFGVGDMRIVNSEYANLGLLIVGDNNNIRFYSLTLNKFITPSLQNAMTTFSVNPDSNVGYILEIYYKENLYVYDGLGNQIAKEEYSNLEYHSFVNHGLGAVVHSSSPSRFSTSTQYYKGNVVIGASSYASSASSSLLAYRSSGELFGVASLEDVPQFAGFDDQFEQEPEDEDPYFDYGDKYIDRNENNWKDLTLYGLPGYHLAKNSKQNKLWTVFDTDDKKVCTFSATSFGDMLLADGKLIYQETLNLPADAKEYDYSEGDGKFSLKTYSVNLKTGYVETLKFPYVISTGKSFKNHKGLFQYLYVYVNKIQDDKALSANTNELLVGNDLSVLKDFTNYKVDSFIQIDENHYYNESNKIIYDSNINETLYIGALNPHYIESEKIFVGDINGTYGAIDADGKTVIPFDYQEFLLGHKTNDYVFQDGYTLAKDRKGDWYRVTPRENRRQYLGTTLKKLFDDCYLFSDNNSFTVCDFENDYLDKMFYDDYLSSYNYSMNLGTAKYAFVYADDVCYRFAKDEVLNKDTFKNPEVIDTDGVLAVNGYTPVSLNVGNNSLLIGNGSNYRFSTSKDRYYTFVATSSVNFDMKTSSGSTEKQSNGVAFDFIATSAQTKNFVLKSNAISSPWTVKNVELEINEYKQSEHYNYPTSMTSGVGYTFASSDEVYKYYTFKPTATGYYDIEFTSTKLPVFSCLSGSYTGHEESWSRVDDFKYRKYLSSGTQYCFIFSTDYNETTSTSVVISLE